MQKIVEGLMKFQREIFPRERPLFERLANNQNPTALFITCSDSRIVPDLITQTEPGDLFICRNAGNIVPPYGEVQGGVTATIEYAVTALGIGNIIVCGHSNCGAMKGVLHPESLGSMPSVARWLRHGDAARKVAERLYPGIQGEDLLRAVTEQNVVAQVRNLLTHPSVVARAAEGKLNVYGWVYDIHRGTIRGFDGETGVFTPLTHSRMPLATARFATLPAAV